MGPLPGSWLSMCVKTAGGVANSVDPDQMPHFAASDLGQHCLLRPVCPNTKVYLGNKSTNLQVAHKSLQYLPVLA